MLLELAANALTRIAARERRKPLRYEVALLSRQSAHVSRDFALLRDELVSRRGADAVVVNACESELGGKFRFAASMREQVSIASRSRIVVLDGYNPAVCVPPKSDRTKVVQLWHAAGAVKKFGYQAIDTPAGRSGAYARAAHMHENYDAIVAAGPGAVGPFAQAFGYAEDRVRVLGAPHLDYLLDRREGSAYTARRSRVAGAFPFLEDGARVVVYAPTLRRGERYAGWETRYLGALAEALEAEVGGAAARLVYAGHPLDHDFDEGLLDAHPCIKLCPGVETIDLLGFADCVVTDYSSVALEAGLAGRDVCFYVPDLESYEKSPGLNVDLRDPSVCLGSGDARVIMRAALGGSDAGFDAWRAYAARYFAGLELGSTTRIADFIESLL